MPGVMPALQGSRLPNNIQISGAFTKQEVDLAEIGVEKYIFHRVYDGLIWFRRNLSSSFWSSLSLSCALSFSSSKASCLPVTYLKYSGSTILPIARPLLPAMVHAIFPVPTSTASPWLAAANYESVGINSIESTVNEKCFLLLVLWQLVYDTALATFEH